MANSSANAVSRKPRRWLKIIGIICGALFVLVLITYFVVTSSGFFKGVILPKVSKAVGADVTVASAEIHPFRAVVLHDFKVQVKGAEPIVTAKQVTARYSLWSIIRGNIVVKEATVTSPVISLVVKPDGSNNLPKPPPSEKSPPEETEKAKSSKPPQVDIQKIAITGGTIRYRQEFPNGKSNFAEISDFNFSTENIQNGQTAKLNVGFDATIANNPPVATQAGSAFANAAGEINVMLSKDLTPESVTGGLHLNISRASGALADLSSVTASLQSEITPTEIKQLALRFVRDGATLGEIDASGPFDLAKSEGRINVDVRSIDRQVLNLVGAASGIDFGTTSINSTNQIGVSNAGKSIALTGHFSLDKFQVKHGGDTSPTLDLNASYELAADLDAGNAVLRDLNLNGDQNNVPFLRANLSGPMSFAWNTPPANGAESTLTLNVNNFNLGDWRTLDGDLVSDGTLNTSLKLSSLNSGKKLVIDLEAGIADLAANLAGGKLSQVGIDFATHINANDLKQFQIANYQLNVTQAQKPLVSLSGQGTCDTAAANSEIQADIQANLANLMAAFPLPGIAAQSGSVTVNAHVAQNKSAQNVTGNLSLSDFTGEFAGSHFQDYSADAVLNLAMDSKAVNIQKIAGALREGGKAGGTFTVSGQYQLADGSGKFDLKLDGLNENAVRPILEPMLAGKKLVSVNINANANAQYDPKGATAITADAQVANLVVNDSPSSTPAAPLEAKLQVDAALKNQIAKVNKFQIGLTPTDRAKNQIQLQGQVDLSDTNGFSGGLRLSADALDLTSYYDLFSAQTNAAASKPATTPQSAPNQPAASAEAEPAPITLPFQNFTVDAGVGKIYLHDIDVSDFKTTLKLDRSRVLLKPFQFSFNNRPVSANADLNLGVPGYQYDVSFLADTIPLPPLVDALDPTQKGHVSGTLYANAQIKGAGTTGADLQKNLTGKFDLMTTNMNLLVINLREGSSVGMTRLVMGLIIRVINVVGAIPDLVNNIKNPTALLGTLSGTGNSETGLTGKINHSPINNVTLHGIAGNGKIEIKQATVEGTLFTADAAGTVTLDKILTNSPIDFPVNISLERGMATSFGLGSLATSTNNPFIALPQFVTMVGTVGAATPKYDKSAILKIAGTAGLTAGKGVVGLYQELTGSASTNTTATNSLIQEGEGLFKSLFGGKKKKK